MQCVLQRAADCVLLLSLPPLITMVMMMMMMLLLLLLLLLLPLLLLPPLLLPSPSAPAIPRPGVMACPEGKTHDGFETQIGVNHLGHHLLLRLLTPALLLSASAERPSRLVSLSSSAHRMARPDLADLHFERRAYDQWAAYGQAKTANIWLALEAERRYGARGLHALAVHPGVIRTELSRHMPAEAVAGWSDPSSPMAAPMKSTQQGAATTVWAAVGAELRGRGGLYLEDVSEPALRAVQPGTGFADVMGGGRAEYAYDADAARQLWDISDKLTAAPSDSQ
jgi:NAD(P)-dependent dehydrogenase (short-subunit alcohol dehydrogenase family)